MPPYVKSIATFAPTFYGYIIPALASVLLVRQFLLRERPLMMSDDFRRFLTYVSYLFNPKTSEFLGNFEPNTYPKIGRH